MKDYEPTQYLAAGCNFALESPRVFFGVHVVTKGRVCDTGCAEFSDGKCAAYRGLTATASAIPAASEVGETVRQEAARRSLSISEVRRQRAKLNTEGRSE